MSVSRRAGVRCMMGSCSGSKLVNGEAVVRGSDLLANPFCANQVGVCCLRGAVSKDFVSVLKV